MKRHIKYALELALVPLAAAIVFFEQTLIRYLNIGMARFARLTAIARFETWLISLPPYWALLAFIAPSLLILPIKFSALWFGMHRHYGLAVAAVIVGKVLATAIVARLYRILRPGLMSIGWFARADTSFFYGRDQAYAFVRSLPAWQKAAALVARMRLRLAELYSAIFAR